MKTLIIPDWRVTEELWRKCFKEYLGDLYDELELRFLSLESDRSFRSKYTRIKEFAGDPSKVAAEIKDTEILVVQFAPVSEETIKAGKKLKLVACSRSTPVNVDLEAATEAGIPVIKGAGRNADSVADFTMGLLLSEVRHIARAFESVRNGTYTGYQGGAREKWRKSIPELKGKTMGIVGVGFIGVKLAERAKGFGLRLLGYDPYVSEEKMRDIDVEKTDLETLLKESDFISVTVRLTPETTGMIGKKEFDMMKETAILVNTSRGAVIDEDAMYAALKNKKIAGAALDVFVKEPITEDPDNKFIHMDNVTFTPHLAGPSDDMMYRGSCIIAEDIARFLKGEKMKNIMNPSVLPSE
ncbi:MAG: 2-hydroxyacid dehydrogenase [Candidatus Bathyarchaeota archaeon]|nr:MAG: 2-hydroxyacid dehydrogenase [Candidatus Bathyarchaeota archaeon]